MKKRHKLRNGIIISVAVILVIAIVGIIFGANYLCNYALYRYSDDSLKVSSGGLAPAGSWLDQNAKDVYITSQDGLKLHAFLVENKSETANGNFMMVFHGYKGAAADMSAFAEKFYELGYSVLLPDARAHGQSEGEYIGMGWPERLDNLLWIDEIIKMDKNTKIGLFGISMGGATVINTAGENLPKQVVVAVEDCGYSSAADQLAHQMNEKFHLPSFPILNVASLIAESKSGVDLYEADSTKQAAKIKIPTLFIHGKQDNFVPFSMLQELYDAAACEKEMLVIDNAGHGQSATQNPLLYWNTVSRFLEDNMN